MSVCLCRMIATSCWNERFAQDLSQLFGFDTLHNGFVNGVACMYIQYKLGKHRSNAMELVHKVPIIEVDGNMAICDGGGGALGHPLEYISLARPGAVEYCKYCSLRYTSKKKH
jgi:uncharacterized Zn-finger protein